jgi:amino acid permease
MLRTFNLERILFRIFVAALIIMLLSCSDEHDQRTSMGSFMIAIVAIVVLYLFMTWLTKPKRTTPGYRPEIQPRACDCVGEYSGEPCICGKYSGGCYL